MAEQLNFEYKSERVLRNGNMGFVIKLANLIKRRAEVDHLTDLVPEQLNSTEWRLFINGELDKSNTNNNKSLGGHSRSQPDEEEEEETPIDVNMERIMARFNTYSQMMSQNSYSRTADDDDNEEFEDVVTDDKEEDQFDHLGRDDDAQPMEASEISKTKEGPPRLEVEVPKEVELVKEFVDLSYWRTIVTDTDLEDLLADYE